MRFQIQNRRTQIVIVGAGPAGTSLAIRLATAGFSVALIERDSFPRHKLCGEFISPECLRHFRDLEVIGTLLNAGGKRIAETRFYSMSGRSAVVPSRWLGGGESALSLSRAKMDHLLLERAEACGVEILEATSVTGIARNSHNITGLTLRDACGNSTQKTANIFIDATGRNAVLSKLIRRLDGEQSSQKATIVGLKTHVREAAIRPDRCEIYSFPDGYGGLSPIEDGLANLCFMVRADRVRELRGDPDRIVSDLVFRNQRAARTLSNAEPTMKWLSVPILGFGRRGTSIAENAFSVGDSAAFIDPFTGSGMLMALESAEILAESIIGLSHDTALIARAYGHLHAAKFNRRLTFCRLLRHAAFQPAIGTLAVKAMSMNGSFRRMVARSTRSSEQIDSR